MHSRKASNRNQHMLLSMVPWRFTERLCIQHTGQPYLRLKSNGKLWKVLISLHEVLQVRRWLAKKTENISM